MAGKAEGRASVLGCLLDSWVHGSFHKFRGRPGSETDIRESSGDLNSDQ